jgi:hypothetical protein
MSKEIYSGMMLTGENRRTQKNLSDATLSTTKSTWTEPGLRGERQATTRLNHDTACWVGVLVT